MSNRNSGTPSIRELEAFVAVMATGSMTAASQQLGIGQPAVTRMVRDLEILIGFDLFQRNGPRISPTSKGLRFFEDARQLLQNYEQVTQRAASLKDDRVKALSLAASPTMAAGLVPRLLASIDHAVGLPPQVTLHTMDAEHLAQSLQSGGADYGICALPVAHSDLECLAVARAGLVAALPPDLPECPLDLSHLRERRLLSLGNSYRIRHAINSALAVRGIAPISELVTNSSINAISAANAGLGIALVDCVSAHGAKLEGARIVPLQEPIPYEWGLFRRAGSGLPEIEDAMVAGFQEASRQVGAGL